MHRKRVEKEIAIEDNDGDRDAFFIQLLSKLQMNEAEEKDFFKSCK